MSSDKGVDVKTKVLNFNIGIVGHIDSGKTSLAKALSTVASTASFDKNPQSKERGITLDLGFSSFTVELPHHLQDGEPQGEAAITQERLQYTLVDCPGHASLIRTIIGGAQIVDMIMLVVDITKGMQTQTAECLVIAEIMCKKMIVVLNKIDLVPQQKREATVEKITKRMLKTLENTPFAGCPVVSVACKPGGAESENTDSEAQGVDTLVDTIKSNTHRPWRSAQGPFMCAVDHCFSIRGQGTIMTGTVLSGSVKVNDSIEIPSMKIVKKVKSMQMFRSPVETAMQGDRIGICVTQFDPKQLERGLVCSPNIMSSMLAGIASVEKIPYFKGNICSKSKFHVTIGYETVMAKVTFFSTIAETQVERKEGDMQDFDFLQEYVYQNELFATDLRNRNSATAAEASEALEKLAPGRQFALLEFERPVTAPDKCLLIGSKLDTDIHTNTCRLAFNGKIVHAISDPKYVEAILPKLKVFKYKSKEGMVERKADDYSVICHGIFKKETNMDLFTGLKVHLSTGEHGVIEGSFGQSGKFKVRIPAGLSAESVAILGEKSKKGKKKETTIEGEERKTIQLFIKFKHYMYDPTRKMVQT